MDLHIFFLPFLAPGHMIPMIDLAKIFADRGVKVSIVTTTGNIPRIQPTIDLANNSCHSSRHHIQLIPLHFPYSESGVPKGHENLINFSDPGISPEFITAINLLEAPFMQLAKDHRPDCIISDIFYPWTSSIAHELRIPRLVFHGSGMFTYAVMCVIKDLKPYEGVNSDRQPFVVQGLPHRIEMTRSQLPEFVTEARTGFFKETDDAHDMTYGMVMNSFNELESDYANLLKKMLSMKVWHVGPVSLFNQDVNDEMARGDKASIDCNHCLSWLDTKKPRSVLYICFGSLGRFTHAQLQEIALGLEASEHPFIWVVRYNDELSAWLPEGFENRVISEGRGVIISGWAPQLLILNHPAVGGFMTHCGWNSCLEGTVAGLPMITWPLFAEQFFSERLIVDVLRIGIAIGVKVCSGNEEEREMVMGEGIKKVVDELMGNGEEADGRRERAKELGVMARRAVEVGGSSYNDMSHLIEDLLSLRSA
ncbi:scopoletin glucosyltransferase-like [Phoenix dactylifera]|uniref:Scopoletin glucosyltransferase-like n=1 Tax=Phoenix dactylifera TaxID=42345 RepID=A0A8B7BEI4_PHODC|nr:scopoletin glucosyltransferase-like [Phoenix dactylifera]